MSKVIISGATSMIGTAILDECLKNGVKVIAMVRKNSTNLGRLPHSDLLEIVECSLDEFSKFPTGQYVDDKIDVFYHCAWGSTEKAYRNDAERQNVNITYTLDAVRLAKKLGCSVFIGTGSQAEYGRIENRISPDTPVNPDFAYGVAKYAAGKLSHILCQELGIKHIWGRIFSVYGLHDNKDTMIMYAINSMLSGSETEFTKCEQNWDYLYSKDAGAAFYLMGLYGKDGSTYCVGSGHTRKLSEYISLIHQFTESQLESGIGKKEYANNQVMNLCADITNLTRDTGFTPQYSFEEGIKETIQWVRETEK